MNRKEIIMPKDKDGNDLPEVNKVSKDDLYLMYNTNTKNGGLPDTHAPITPEDGDEDELDSDINDDGIIPDQHLEPEVPETMTDDQVQQLLKLPDAKLIEYGIDDPKQWKSYQRALTKATLELKQLKSQMQPQVNSDIELLKQQIAELKVPTQRQESLKAPVPPKMPQKPMNFNWANVSMEGTAEANYMQAKVDFDEKQYEYQIQMADYNSHLLQNVNKAFEEERQTRIKGQQMDAMKTDGIKRLMATGLNANEAREVWEAASDPNNMSQFYSPENIAKLYKINKGGNPINNDRSNKFDQRRNNRKNFPPPGIGSGRNDNPRSNEFSKNSDHSDMYKPRK